MGQRQWLASTVVKADHRSGRLVRSVVVRTLAAGAAKPRNQGIGRASGGGVVTRQELDRLVRESAVRYGVDPLLVHAMIRVESNYNPYAVSPKGAEGLMQLMPSTARHLGVKNSFDRRENIEGGVRYLRNLLDRFGDERLALAAYNAGEEAVLRYRGIPPYSETRNYVYSVGKWWGELRKMEKKQEAARAAVQAPPAEVYKPVEAYLDPEGRLSLRTR